LGAIVKLLVTGGAGYIGSVVTDQLIDAGHEVVVLDNLSTGHRQALVDGAEFAREELSRVGQVLDASFDGVLHFAAKSLVAESVERPEIYWENNVVGTLALLAAMRTAGVGRLIFSSTAATYGVPHRVPIQEDDPAVPINPYGQSKLAVDMAISGAARAHGLAAASLRYFNVGGARGRLGERHSPESHLIPNVLMVPLGIRESVSIFGTDYETRDGTCVRDYLHVVDLGRAHLLALDAVEPGRHTIYNLGSGTGYTVREVVESCRQVTGHPVPSVDLARRSGDPPALVASSRLIHAELGWRPEFDLDRIVSDAWRFAQDHR
jgi:UDP-glucose 4-epimerase